MKENELLKVKTDIEEEKKMKKNKTNKKITQKRFPRFTASNGSSEIQH